MHCVPHGILPLASAADDQRRFTHYGHTMTEPAAQVPSLDTARLRLRCLSNAIRNCPLVLPHAAMLPKRSVGNRHVVASFRPGRDGSWRFDRDHRLRPVDEELCRPPSPRLYEALKRAELPSAEASRRVFAKPIHNGNGREVRFAGEPCLDAHNVRV